MEEYKECDDIGLELQDGSTGNHIHHFYFVKFRPSYVEFEKEEADKLYQLMTVARLRINEEIAQLKVEEHEINKKVLWFPCGKEYFTEYKLSQDYVLANSVPRTTGFLRLTKKGPRTPVQNRSQKMLIKKGKRDIEYFQQVQEELISSKNSNGMASYGTQELNIMKIDSMVKTIQHGNKKRTEEMKIYQEIRNIKETRELYNVPSAPDPRSYWRFRARELRSNRSTEWKRSIKHINIIRLDDNQKRRVSELNMDLGLVRKKISCLQKELEDVNLKRLKAYNRAYELGEQMKELVESCFNEYQLVTTYVKEVAQKDVPKLKQLCDTQVEGFMKQWIDDKTFRDDYVRRKLVTK